MKDRSFNQNLSWPALLNAISEIAEMRRTYAAIEKSFADPGPRSIVVSSAATLEGKTLTASGLATLVAGQGHKRVLAVDLNWHRPALHSVFGLEQSFSVDKLRDGTGIAGLVQKSETDHLDVLVAPLQDKRSVEAGVQFNLLAEKIIQQAHETYDIAIIDTSAMYPTNPITGKSVIKQYKIDEVQLKSIIFHNHELDVFMEDGRQLLHDAIKEREQSAERYQDAPKTKEEVGLPYNPGKDYGPDIETMRRQRIVAPMGKGIILELVFDRAQIEAAIERQKRQPKKPAKEGKPAKRIRLLKKGQERGLPKQFDNYKKYQEFLETVGIDGEKPEPVSEKTFRKQAGPYVPYKYKKTGPRRR